MDSSTTEYTLTHHSTFRCETDFESDSLERSHKPILQRILGPLKAKVNRKQKASEDISGPTEVDEGVASDDRISMRSRRAQSLNRETNIQVDETQRPRSTDDLFPFQVGVDDEQDSFPRGRSRVRGERSKRLRAAALRQRQMKRLGHEPVQPIHIVEGTAELEGRKVIVLTDDLVKRLQAAIEVERNVRLVQQQIIRDQSYYQKLIRRINETGNSLHARQAEMDYSLIEDERLVEFEYNAIRQHKLALISLEKAVIKKHHEASDMLRKEKLKQVEVNSEINRMLDEAFMAWHMIEGRPTATHRYHETFPQSAGIDIEQLEKIEGLLSIRHLEPQVPRAVPETAPDDQPRAVSSRNVGDQNPEPHATVRATESNGARVPILTSAASKSVSRLPLKGWMKRQKLKLPALKLVRRKNRSTVDRKQDFDVVVAINALSDAKDQLNNIIENIKRFEDQGMVHQHAEFRSTQTKKVNSLEAQIKKLQADIAKHQSGDDPVEMSLTMESILPHHLRQKYPDLASEYFDKTRDADRSDDSVGGKSLDRDDIEEWLEQEKAGSHNIAPDLTKGDRWEAKSVGYCHSVEISARGKSRKLIDWWRRTADEKGQLQSRAAESDNGDGAALTVMSQNGATSALVPQDPGSSSMAATFGWREADRSPGCNAIATPRRLITNVDRAPRKSLRHADLELHRESRSRFLDFADGP